MSVLTVTEKVCWNLLMSWRIFQFLLWFCRFYIIYFRVYLGVSIDISQIDFCNNYVIIIFVSNVYFSVNVFVYWTSYIRFIFFSYFPDISFCNFYFCTHDLFVIFNFRYVSYKQCEERVKKKLGLASLSFNCSN